MFFGEQTYCLTDINNCYPSCEAVFDPSLKGWPVVVLSNNDGCVIARNQEAKDLGIKMGDVPHLIPDLIKQCKIFSSNYTLYGDMSDRVMNTIREFSPEVEVYSVDECFIRVNRQDTFMLYFLGSSIKERIKAVTGLPVSVGIGPTKTLAKMANKYAKKVKPIGVYVINSEDARIEALKGCEIGDVWGIGQQHAKRLIANGITTAYEFSVLNLEWVRKNMTVVGVRMHQELNGHPCLEMKETVATKQNICTSRSFGKLLETLPDMSEAVANYVATCARKLRKDGTCANMLQVFLHTNPYRTDLSQYANSKTIALPEATNSTIELAHYALALLKALYRPGYKYMKAGVIVSGLIPEHSRQEVLFPKMNHEKHSKAMKALDLLNSHFGAGSVRMASMAGHRKYALRAGMKSGHYTTKWSDIIKVSV